jgi:hypothetical protein
LITVDVVRITVLTGCESCIKIGLPPHPHRAWLAGEDFFREFQNQTPATCGEFFNSKHLQSAPQFQNQTPATSAQKIKTKNLQRAGGLTGA